MQRSVAREFEALRDSRFHVIDGSRSVEVVHAEVRSIACQILERCSRGGYPVLSLWEDRNDQEVKESSS
jgi:hypothetical protein